MISSLFNVDLMTMLRLCALTALLFGVGMLLAAASVDRHRRVLAHIGIANLMFVAAMALVAERGAISSLLTDVMPSVLTIAGIQVWHRGSAILLGLKQQLRGPVAALAFVVATMLVTDFPHNDPRPGGAAFFGVVAWMMLHNAWQFHGALRNHMGEILRLAIIAPKLVFGGFALVRVLLLLTLPAAGGLVFVNQDSLLNTVLFLIVFMNLVGLNVGFALMMGLNLVRTTEQLHYQARHDLLTDLFNRRALLELLEREIARRGRGAPVFSVLMIDLDHFKRFNDRHGHLVGDAVLIHVADTLRQVARTEDVVARFGGEEFCVLLPGIGADGAMLAGERLRAALAATPFTCCASIEEQVTISVGVATHDVASEPWDGLLGRADAALYAAKAGGRNTVRSASPMVHEVATISPAGIPAAAH